MNLLSNIIYGIIQGVTEFLPVSSSGHLALLPKFLNINDPGVFFDLTMHVGTGLSVTTYFWKEIKTILKDFLCFILGKTEKYSTEYNLMFNMLISTLSSFFIIVLIQSFINLADKRTPFLIAINLMVFGVIMFLADFSQRKHNNKIDLGYMSKNIRWKESLGVGLFQGIAIFPGVSRSGITLTISRFMGLSRLESTRYSFLLSLPIIFGGFVLKLPQALKGTEVFSLSDCLVGGSVSFIFGLISIHFFIKLINRIGLGVFSFYRVLLGLFLIFG